MNTEALIWMLTVQVSVTAAMVYFFYRVFKADRNAQPKSEDKRR